MRWSTNGMRIEREETETESSRDGTSKWSTNKTNRNRAQTESVDRDGAGTEGVGESLCCSFEFTANVLKCKMTYNGRCTFTH